MKIFPQSQKKQGIAQLWILWIMLIKSLRQPHGIRIFPYFVEIKGNLSISGKNTLCKLKNPHPRGKVFPNQMWIMWITIVQAGVPLLVQCLRPPLLSTSHRLYNFLAENLQFRQKRENNGIHSLNFVTFSGGLWS